LSLISQAYGLYISQNDLEELANALPEFSRLMPTYSGRRVLLSGLTIGSVLGGIAGAIAFGTITLATGGADLALIGLTGGAAALVGSQIGGVIGYHVDEKNLQKIEGAVAQYDHSCCVDSNGETYPVHFRPWVADWMRFQSYDPATVDGVGVLVGVEFGALKGMLIKTREKEYLNHTTNEDGHYSWVFTPQSAIIYKWNAGKDLSNKNYIRHSTLFGGLPVVCAGEFYIDASTKSISHAISKLNDSSGHYQPDGGKCLGPVLTKLKALGLDIDDIEVTTV